MRCVKNKNRLGNAPFKPWPLVLFSNVMNQRFVSPITVNLLAEL